MTSLAALLLASPVFGLSLNPPGVQPLIDPAVYAVVATDIRAATPALLQAGEGFAAEGDDEASGGGDDQASSDDDASKDSDTADSSSSSDDDYKAQIKRRNSLIKVHRPLGLATWGAMTVTVALGIIQYYNLYGFFAGQGDNPCVKGTAVFGQGQCSGTPWPHAVAAGVTTGLYAATFTVPLMMPDPDDLAHSKGAFGDTLRMHKLLRWVHFGGMVAQILLGIAMSNGITGLDRANDYGTLRTLATVHLATGLITYGALTWAGALMTF
jgi:hypothetical protein